MHQRETRSPRYFFRRHLRLQRGLLSSLMALVATLGHAGATLAADTDRHEVSESNAADLAELGSRHQLASRLTRLVALEATPRRAQGELLTQQPVMQGASTASTGLAGASHDDLTDLVFVTSLTLFAFVVARSRS